MFLLLTVYTITILCEFDLDENAQFKNKYNM